MVAVLSILEAVRIPENPEVEMSGEALLNDGVGMVVFSEGSDAAPSGNS